MKPYFFSKVLFVLNLFIVTINSPFPCLAGSYVINPSDDGYIYNDGSVFRAITFSYLSCSGVQQGIVEFPIGTLNENIVSASLSVNPYGLPIGNPTIHVYGYQSTDGIVTTSDYSAGVFLGDWSLPSLNFGQDAYFNVTNFLETATTPYVGFNLRCEGGPDIFSSLEHNYGHPSQLSVSTIPEPATLLLLGLGGLILRKRRA